MVISGGEGGKNAGRSGSGGGKVGMVGTTENSLLDVVLLPELSVLLGLVGGRAEAFCCDTGLVLAILAGHALPVSCMQWMPSQLMLATGSADATVRVWDVGEEILPHADEWTRVKRECFLGSSNERGLEQNITQEKAFRPYQDQSSVSEEITALENALVLGQDVEDDDRSNSRSNQGAHSDGVASGPQRESNGTTLPPRSSAVAATEAASKEKARCALRSLRQEIFRQAGVHPAWRTGRVTAVLDRSTCSLNHPVAATGSAPGRGQRAKPDPLIEVTYEDGAMELGVNLRHLRRPEEACRQLDKNCGVGGGMESCLPTAGPDWEQQPVRPAVGVKVAVHGLCKARLCRLVAALMVRVSGDDDAHDTSTSAKDPFSPPPPTRADVLAVLETIRGRAACAAADSGDNKDEGSSSYNHGNYNVYNGRANDEDDGNALSSPFALEAALEATDVSDENLRALADALAAEARKADCSYQLFAWRRSAGTTSSGVGSGILKVGAVDSIVFPGGGVSSLVVCDPERARAAQAMDEEQPWDPASTGNGGGFFYLSSSGEVLSVPSPNGFEERYVLLDDASFFEVSGPLGAAQSGGDGGEEVAARFREIFRKRAGMSRVVYTSAVVPRSVEAIGRQMNDTGVAAKRRSVLDAQFPGQRFVVFYREGDGPDRDITEAIGFSYNDASSRTGYPPNDTVTADDTAAGGVEFLRVEVCSGGGGGHRFPDRGGVSHWAVGRVALRVEARSFDRELGEDRRAAAGFAFMSSWALTMQHLRGLNSARAAASRSRANAEARLVARVSCGLRLCSLDRACGEEVADAVGTAALTQALAAALRLPSRFPHCGASLSRSADYPRFGAYVQAAKVLRFLTAAGAQQSETSVVEGKTGPTATLLLESLREAAFFSPLDPVAWHFLRPVLTPAFQEALSGEDGKGRRAPGRTIEWNGLRAALDTAGVHRQHMATTEEAFTLLVKFGQAPPCGALLEPFARNAEGLRSGSLFAAPVPVGLGTTPAVWSVHGRSDEPDAPHDSNARAVLGRWKNEEASSVLLGANEIAALAVELDPMRRIDHAFTSVAEAFRGDDVSTALVASTTGRPKRERYRSPLHSYAVARRCRGWMNKLDTVGSCLATTRRRLGRRGQDLLVLNSGLAANTQARYATSILPAAAVSATELIAQAKAMTATATRRKDADEAGRRRGRDAIGSGHRIDAIITARIHRYAPILERSARGVQAFDGQGYYGHAASSRKEGAGEPVAVLEVWPSLGKHEESMGNGLSGDGGGGGEKPITGENLAFVASVLSVRGIRAQPGLLNIHSEAVVVEDGRKDEHQSFTASERQEEGYESAANDAGATHRRPTQIICERLAGWKPLCTVVRERGPFVTPSDIAAGEGRDGLRVLRLWGGQLAAALECLASTSLVLRDLRASTVLVSPDGSTVKVVGFLNLTTVSSDGEIVSSEAPDLESDIHGPKKPLTPPEALMISRVLGNHEASDNDEFLAGSRQYGPPSEIFLVLAGDRGFGKTPITPKWDVWTLGILLFQLAFGHSPPAYGDCLRQGLSSFNSEISNAAGGTKGGPVPTVGELLSVIHYDFLSTVGLQSTGGAPGEAFATNHVAYSPLENALEFMSLGAAIGERDTFHVVSTVGDRDASMAVSEIGGGDGVRQAVQRFRSAWVRRQLQMEERGEVDVMTWQGFQEKLRRHLDVSIAPATMATAAPSRRQEVSPQGGGDEGGGRRRVNFVGAGDDTATAPSTRNHTTREAAEAAVQRTAARLLAADPRDTGRVPFSVARGVVSDELQLTFSTSEAKLVEFCLRDSAEPGGIHGGGEDERNVGGGHVRREGDGDVCYQPLVHILHALSLPIGGGAQGPPPRSSNARHGPLPPPTPTSFVEVLSACLEPTLDRRLCARSLLSLPFFSRCGIEKGAFKNTDDLRAASMYMAGTGNEHSLTWALRERVESRILALEAASADGAAADHKEKSERAATARTTRGISCALKNSGAGSLVEALKELEHLVHRSSPATNYLTEDDHPQQTRRVARGHARVVDEIFESGVLMRACALALRFLGREEADAVGRGISGVGFVEGDPKKTVGARVLLSVARVLEVLLMDLRRPGSAVRPYVDVVLRCLVTLFLGEEGSLAVRYGRIGHPPDGRQSTAAGNSSKSWMAGRQGGQSRWRPAISQIFEGLLVEAVGETGEGGFSYPPIQRYIRRCGLATHRVGSGDNCGEGSRDSLDILWDAGGGGGSGGEDEYDGGRDEGGRRALGERPRRRRSDETPGHDESWTSSSEDDDNNNDYGGNARSGGLVRSHIVPLFVRAPAYFAELLALGRVLYAIDRSSSPRRTMNGAAGQARRQAIAYCLTVVRMCSDVGSGGLDNAEPPNWVGGGRELDEDAGTLQRAQLLVDARLGEKLAPCLNDSDPDVRRDAMSCALSALRGGHERLRWISLSVRETEEVDPRALLSLGFCSTVWVSAFAGLLRGRGVPATGQVNPSRPAREAEENARRMALQCLGYMAAAGDLATHSWRGVRVLSALIGMLNRGGASLKDGSLTAAGLGRRSSTVSNREGRKAPDFVGWKEGVFGVLRSLAENGSGETHSMLRAQSGFGASFSDPELILNSESLLAPKGLASTAIELLKGAGTLSEIISLIRRTRSTLATAVRIGDQRVLGATDANVPEDIEVTLSLVWGWMQRALVQLARDDPDHPSAAGRASLAWECLTLIHFLLGSPTACRLARCKTHPDLVAEVSRASGSDDGAGGEESSSSDNGVNGHTAVTADATLNLATARTGLETEKHGRVATALDRMGAAVVEVRDAFQRWVPHEGPSVAAVRSPSSRTNNKRAVSFSAPEKKAALSNGNETSQAGLQEAMLRAMTDLRLPRQTAKAFCEGAGADGVAVTFSDFVCRFADASGLLKELASSDKEGGRTVWVEGSAGAWFAIPLKDLKDVQRVFDEQIANQEDQDQESKSSDGGFRAEESLAKENAIVALKCLRPEVVNSTELDSYFDDRGRVIDELFGGRVSFQEFTRAIVHLNPEALPHEGDGRSGAGDNARLSSTMRSRSASPPGYFDGMPGRILGSSAPNDPRSPPPPYPGSISIAGALAGGEDQESPVAGLAKTAAGLTLDHDADEERRAWAQRAGVGRVTRGAASRTSARAANRVPMISSKLNQQPPSETGRGRTGQIGGTVDNKGSRYGIGGDDEAWEEEDDDAAISGPERERALRKAFELYDLNGDGFITYLELKAAFEHRGVHASAADIREWIRQRDTSGTGAVDFADFSRAFVFSS
eukprot:g7826.t1